MTVTLTPQPQNVREGDAIRVGDQILQWRGGEWVVTSSSRVYPNRHEARKAAKLARSNRNSRFNTKR